MLSAEFRPQANQIATNDFSTLISLREGISIDIEVVYEIYNFEEKDNWSLSIKKGSQEIYYCAITQKEETILVNFKAEEIATYKTRLPLTVRLFENDDEREKKVIRLDLVGPQRPAVIAVEDKFCLLYTSPSPRD